MTNPIPIGIRVLPRSVCFDRNVSYRIYIAIFTFCIYTSYHLSRKPISVVKSVLHRNCSVPLKATFVGNASKPENVSCDWAPFDGNDSETLLGSLDYAFLFAYALGMFASGHIAERMNLRIFLSLGMLSTGIMTAAFGFGYFFNIHSLAFYIVIQAVSGIVQSTGWPSVVSCMGNWFGKGKRGFIMGIWNSHTSVGNILGSLIAGFWVNTQWGWSFVVPGIIIGSLGILVFLFLVPGPEDVNCSLPDHQGTHVATDTQNKVITVTPPSKEDKYISSVQEPDIDSEDPEYFPKTSADPLIPKHGDKAISVWRAIRIPGVLEFSFCLFFAKLVSYTFLFWLPKYISEKAKYDAEESADLSTLFDVGGIVGGILAGAVSDYSGARASTCMVMLAAAAPMLYVYDLYGSTSFATNIGLLMLAGALVNGPYALITTAVSADLGTHKSLRGNSKALATVTAIIDGTGSIGAAIGPLLTGIIAPTGWYNVFYMLITADLIALVLLLRLVFKEFQRICLGRVEEEY